MFSAIFAFNGVFAMLKKLLMLWVAVALSISTGWAAAVDVNTADQTALESVKGIGPVHAKAIIDERTKNGPFKNADDLAARVKGLGTKSVTNLEAAGLTVNGSSAPPTGAKASSSSSKPGTKTAPKTIASEAHVPAAANTAAASAPGDASAVKHSKSKKSKNKAASASAASGA
jgi:competence protein ComEA